MVNEGDEVRGEVINEGKRDRIERGKETKRGKEGKKRIGKMERKKERNRGIGKKERKKERNEGKERRKGRTDKTSTSNHFLPPLPLSLSFLLSFKLERSRTKTKRLVSPFPGALITLSSAN